jgi:hypothetical protein
VDERFDQTRRYYPELPHDTHPDTAQAIKTAYDQNYQNRDEIQRLRAEMDEMRRPKPSTRQFTGDLQGIKIKAITGPDSLPNGTVLAYSALEGQYAPAQVSGISGQVTQSQLPSVISLGSGFRSIQLQVLTGTQAQFGALQSSSMPLQLGEMFFEYDTGELFFGTPGIGVGYIQVANETQMVEVLKQMQVTLESMRRALVALACQGGQAMEQDFDPNLISEELAVNPPPGR